VNDWKGNDIIQKLEKQVNEEIQKKETEENFKDNMIEADADMNNDNDNHNDKGDQSASSRSKTNIQENDLMSESNSKFKGIPSNSNIKDNNVQMAKNDNKKKVFFSDMATVVDSSKDKLKNLDDLF